MPRLQEVGAEPGTLGYPEQGMPPKTAHVPHATTTRLVFSNSHPRILPDKLVQLVLPLPACSMFPAAGR